MTTRLSEASKVRGRVERGNCSPSNLTVHSAVRGDNGDLIEQVARLHLSPGMKIADVTFGKGVFWRKLDLTQYDFHASDILPREGLRVPVEKRDLKSTGHSAGSFDRVVLDPPYQSEPPKRRFMNASYNNALTTPGFSRDQIIDLYSAGLDEANRILRVGGQAWVKGADEAHGGIQRHFLIDIAASCLLAGFEPIDMFLLLQKGGFPARNFPQRASRKNYSYLVILKKVATILGESENRK